MKWHITGLAALLAVALAACGEPATMPLAEDPAAALSVQEETRPLTPQQVGHRVPDRYIVVLKRDVKDIRGLALQLSRAHGGTLHYVYDHVLGGFAATLPATAVENLRRHPLVERITEDGIASTASQTQFNATWGLDRTDQRNRPLDSRYSYVQTGAGVRVYVVDTGIYYGHQDFGGRASFGYDAFLGGGTDCGTGHGTHVAGTVGGATWGIAKEVELVSVKVLACPGGSESTVISGLNWIAANHVKPAVANFSIRMLTAAGNETTNANVDQALRDLVSAGVITVVAAGNQNINACTMTPGRVTEAIVVGATTSSDAKASFSNHGTCLDLFAPGHNITSAGTSHSTHSRVESGTSMAAPHVSGVAALILSTNPFASHASVESTIRNTGTTGLLTGIGTGSPNRLLSLPTVVRLNGPGSVNVDLSACQWGGWNTVYEAMPAGGTGTYSYEWEMRLYASHSTPWYPAGNGKTLTVNHCDPATMGHIELRVRTTSGTYQALDYKSVSVWYFVM